MPLHPQVKALYQYLGQKKLPPLQQLEPAAAREIAAREGNFSPSAPPMARVENLTIRSAAVSGTEGEIKLRIYTPTEENPLPVLVYFHGGGWVLGDLEVADSFCRQIAHQVGCIVVSVDYRLAPEHKFPTPVEDCYTATQWVASHCGVPDSVISGGDVRRLAIAGDSAGGNLAAAVTLMARSRREFHLCHQVLIYPVTHYSFHTESYRQYAHHYLTTSAMTWYWEHYLSSPDDGKNPLASPLLATDLSNLPPATIITAEYDILRDEAEAYGERLRQAGVPVTITRYDGMIHGFVGMGAVVDTAHIAIAEITTALSAAFHNQI